MKKRIKFKKQVKRNLFKLIILVIISIIGIKLYNNYLYRQSYEYKFLEINYSLSEIKILENSLGNKELDYLLTKQYDSNLVKLLPEKYFLFKNLDRYLNYYKKYNNLKIDKIISHVNVSRDREYYEEPIATDYNKGKLMLINKYYYLSEDYEPEDIIKTTGTYSYANNYLNKLAYEAFKELYNDALLENHTILITSSYRDFKYQNELWTKRKELYGTRKADEYAARAGHSEHQTGYAIDVSDYYDNNDKFVETESFIWMKNNAYKYGFILRYPEDKEEITGYSYEPWHYRYVGKDIANEIYNKNITYDEYYAYYLDKEVN